MIKTKKRAAKVPADPWTAFAWFIGKCAEGFGSELMQQGRSATQARNAVIGCLLAFAAGEACRVARREGREPNLAKWRKATKDAFDRAVHRTKPTKSTEPAPKRSAKR